MMKTQVLLTTMMCTLFFSGFSQANDKVESTYDAKKYQQVCQGKSEGAEVSFAYKGIIWNGTCQPQFMPTNAKGLTGNEAQLNSICRSDAATKSINIEGKDYKGKCSLGYAPPMPKQ